MAVEVTYTQARASLADLLDRATDNRETIIITRRDKQSAALISVEELEGLLETAHLLRSPANAQRLLAALNRALGHSESPTTIADLRALVGLGDEG